jgi:tetratricopeptide (TPR) repeat protein
MSAPTAARAAVTAQTPLERLETMIVQENFAAAIVEAKRMVAAEPDNAASWNALGVALRGLGRARQAIPCLWKSVALDANTAASWSNLGNALKDTKQLGQAIAAHRRAVGLAPKRAVLWHNLGLALSEHRQFGLAVAAFDRALTLEPARHAVQWDRGLARLQQGQYQAGWADYEARLETGQIPKRPLPGRRWDGTAFAGQRLLILAEQGFGDALWVARFLPRVKALGGEVILEARPELIPLLETQGLADRIVAKGTKLPDADLHLQQCSLPGLFTPEPAAVSGAPYLTADPARVARLAPVFADAGRALKLGIVWSGSLTFRDNADRAQPVKRFVESFALPGVKLYSLQKGPVPRTSPPPALDRSSIWRRICRISPIPRRRCSSSIW